MPRLVPQPATNDRPDDRVLVDGLRNNDHAAYEQLFRAYAPAMFRIAYSYVRSEDLAKDVVQDVMLSIWKNRASWEVTGTVQAYLQSATRKRALKMLVADSRAQRHERVFELEDVAPGMSQREPGADAATEAHELVLAIGEAVGRLPERYRRVLLLRAKEQMTYPEIAALLDLPVKTVKTQARRGLERLQRVLRVYFPTL